MTDLDLATDIEEFVDELDDEALDRDTNLVCFQSFGN